MATVDERLTILETEFRTELRHLATKADLKALEGRLESKIERLAWMLLVAVVAVGGLVVATLKLLDG